MSNVRNQTLLRRLLRPLHKAIDQCKSLVLFVFSGKVNSTLVAVSKWSDVNFWRKLSNLSHLHLFGPNFAAPLKGISFEEAAFLSISLTVSESLMHWHICRWNWDKKHILIWLRLASEMKFWSLKHNDAIISSLILFYCCTWLAERENCKRQMFWNLWNFERCRSVCPISSITLIPIPYLSLCSNPTVNPGARDKGVEKKKLEIISTENQNQHEAHTPQVLGFQHCKLL